MSASAIERQPWLRSRRAVSATRSSSVVTAPPSPVVTILRGWKLRQPISPSEPQARPAAAGAERAGRVLDERQVGQLLEPGRAAEEVHGDDRLRPRPDLDLRRVDVHRHRVDVDEHRPQPGERDDVRRRREGVGGDEHLVARLEPEREHREMERGGSRRDRDRVPHLAGTRQLLLELGHERPIVSMPLSSTAVTAASSSGPTSGRARRIGPGTTRSSVPARRRARPAAPSRAAPAPSGRSGSAARRRRSRAARRRSRPGRPVSRLIRWARS